MFLGYQGNTIKFYTENRLDPAIYNLSKVEETDKKYVLIDDEYVLETDEKALNQAKEAKFKENEEKREAFLLSGVTYKDILWDSDLDQKLNISVQVSTMSDEDTVIWVAMDGITSLECTKQDLLNIGALLTQMTAYVWQYKNPEIKTAINRAETIEEIEAIEIDYEMPVNEENIEGDSNDNNL